jgi:hypothetical protein
MAGLKKGREEFAGRAKAFSLWSSSVAFLPITLLQHSANLRFPCLARMLK